MSIQNIIESIFSENYDEYINQIKAKLKENNFKLYRYVPIHDFFDDNNKILENLTHEKQFGIDSLLNKYIYHNKPSFFNDPYDCVFGMNKNAFFRELLGEFTDLKQVTKSIQVLDNNPELLEFDDVYQELDNMDVHPNVKDFLRFILDSAKEVLTKNEDFNFDEGQAEFSKKIMNNPDIYYNLLKPFIANNIDKEDLSAKMQAMQEKIGVNNLSKMQIDPLNIKIADFKEMSKLGGVFLDFQNAEDSITDSVNKFNDRIFKFIDNQFGVASLTTSFDDALMWSHYASSHKGICIEYDFNEHFLDLDSNKMLLIPVNYSEKRITLGPDILDKVDLKNIEEYGRKDLIKFFFEGLYTKNIIWEKEDEWRSISLINSNSSSRKIDFMQISSIYFGNKMSSKTINKLIELIDKDDVLNKIPLYKMVNDISEYKLNLARIK